METIQSTQYAQDDRSSIKFEQFTLDNGLRVILHQDNSIPSLAINVCYHVGSKNDFPQRRGFAHLFEHLMFEGSPNLIPGEYDKYCIQSGGDNNAYTNYDVTSYQLLLPSNCLELGLWLESNRMSGFSVDEEQFEIQKNVVIEEKKQNYDNRPFGSAEIKLAENLFHGTSYGWEVIGNEQDISESRLDDAKLFFGTYYNPNNAVLVICGDIDIEETKLLVKNYFGSISSGNGISKTLFHPVKTNGKLLTIYDNIQTPGIFIGYKIPQENSREYYAFQLLSIILSSGESSRLHKEILYNKQFVSDIGCFVDPREYESVFSFYGFLQPEIGCDAVQKEISEILHDIKENGIKEEELNKALNIVQMREHLRKQTNLSKADLLSHYSVIYDEPELINTAIRNYSTITKDEIVSYLKLFLTHENSVTLYYLPLKES